MELKEDRVLEKMWKGHSLSNVEEELEEQSKRKIFFLGERVVEPVNPVIFENGIFFVEHTSECLIIRPKTVRYYLKLVKGRKRAVKFEQRTKDILIPVIAENSMKWFEKKYVLNGKRNQQGRFIREIWKHRNDVFGEATLG